MKNSKNKKFYSDPDIANAFNDHYGKVAQNLLKDMKKGNNPLSALEYFEKSFYFKPTDKYEIFNIINNLDSKKAIDIYNFPISIIKQVSDLISPALSHIINSSIQKAIFPNELKLSKVVPLFKKGNKDEISNYRPISILPIFDKVFEKIMHIRLVTFFEKFSVLKQQQFGFQKNRSTSDATLRLVDNISLALKNNNFCCAIFLDLAKAFDTVDHDILLGKLDKIGIRGPVLQWFKSYLKNRYQCVSINGTLSKPIEMKFGVPQGSVLGPLLFSIYINDMPDVTNQFSFTLFADDTCLLAKHNSLIGLKNIVNNEMPKIDKWLINNKLSLNSSKSFFLLFTGTEEDNNFEIKWEDKCIKRSNTVKYLGIHLDDKMLWKKQLTNTLFKIKQGSGIIRKLSFLPKSILIMLYYSFIQSHIQYAITSWGSPLTKNISEVSKIVSKTVNKINKKNPDNSFKPLNLSNIYKLESCKLIFKFLNGKLPNILCNLFHKPNHTHLTRHADNGVESIHFHQSSSPITFFGPQFWNKHCTQIQAQSISSFSSSLKSKLNDQ